ncbi:glycosyl hydrolase [Dactylosporangium sp. CA-092794]|uniref:glycosyl hydrolase n=1 Tax=Dactylosporangium sp. CA-092794 TaxID=3239929 RepID=UPI003D919FB3
MRAAIALAAVAVTVALTAGRPAAAAPTPGGTATAADVVSYLQSISGHSIISGQQDGPSSAPNTWQQKVHDITGEYPGEWAGDFAFEQADINARPTVIAQAKSVWAAGSIPALVWHMCPPTVGSSCHWDYGDGAIESKLSDPQWNELVTDGSALNTAFKRRLDEAVPYLQDLKNSGIPVLFRPQHEMNEGWSWWGGRPGPNGSRKLYQITHDYLAGTKGLSNLVWVWNLKDIAGGESHVGDYWPGASYVDLATMDAWVNRQPTQAWYNAMLGIAGGKPIGLSEVGTVPTPETISAQPRWTFFSVWISWLTDPAWNSNNEIKRTYYDSRVLNRGEIHFGASTGVGPVTGLAGKCLDVAASGTANGTKIQLYTCNGTGAQSWTAGTDGTLRALGKCLDVTGGVNANGTKVQLWDCNGNGHQQWSRSGQTLVNPETGKCLDVTGQNSTDGTQIQIWTCNGQTNQNWTLP